MNSNTLEHTTEELVESKTGLNAPKAKIPKGLLGQNPSPKRRKKRLILLALGIVLIAALGIGLYRLFFAQEEKVAITGVTTYGFLNEAIEGSGTTTPADSVTYEVSGTVLEWLVEPGDQVEAGDLLDVLDSSEAEDQILENEVELEDLYEQLANLQESIDGQKVTAPFSGRIEQIQAEEGKTVQSGSTLAQLIDDSHMKATLYFSYIYENDQIGRAHV